MSAVGLTLRQVRYENKAFWRNPAAAFFTFAFPLMFLFIFTTIFGDDTSTLPSGLEVSNSTYYAAAILVFSVITACYTNIAMGVTFAREEGVLKRIRGTPLPGWSYLVGKVLNSIVVMMILVAIVCFVGVVFYDLELPSDTALATIATLVVAAGSFCALGLAITSVIPNVDAAPAIVNATMLPILFLSGVFIPTDHAPAWMQETAKALPVKHFLDAVFAGFIPSPSNPSGWRGGDLLVVALWGVGGLVLAALFFRWEPSR